MKKPKQVGPGAREIMHELSVTYSSELESKKARLDGVIGEKHWLSVGSYKETLIRELLAKKVPRQFEVSTGFVVAVDGNDKLLSNQLDVIVWDSAQNSPVFRDGDFVVVPPEACRAVISVKGNMTRAALSEALDNLASLEKFRPFRRPMSTVHRSVFAFDSEMSHHQVLDVIWQHYAKSPMSVDERVAQTRKNLEGDHLLWIDAVATLGSGVVALEEWGINDALCPAYSAYQTKSDKGNDTYGYVERRLLTNLLAKGQRSMMRLSHPGTHSIFFCRDADLESGQSSLIFPVPDLAKIQRIGSIDPARVPEFVAKIYCPPPSATAPKKTRPRTKPRRSKKTKAAGR